MKKLKSILSIVFTLMIAEGSFTPIKASPPYVNVSMQVFYNNLAPYGNWVSYPDYGYVWVPSVEVGFRPYFSNGHWVLTDEGWMWVSHYNWGWAPFHYGSWMYDDMYGWMWIPGYDWAPAWVTWGYYDEYYGWAPIGPRFSFSVVYYPPIEHWCFVHPRYLGSTAWNQHYFIANQHHIRIENKTVINTVNNITIVKNVNKYNSHQYFAGPPRGDVERISKTPLKPVVIKEQNAPGKPTVSGNTMEVYRPQVRVADKNAKPPKVESLQSLKAKRNESIKSFGNEQVPANTKPDRNHSQEKMEPGKMQSNEQVRNKQDMITKNNERAPVNVRPQQNSVHPKPQRSETPVRNQNRGMHPQEPMMQEREMRNNNNRNENRPPEPRQGRREELQN